MLAMQRMVNFDDVGVILVNDGEENELPKECFDGYPFSICQMSIPKGGVSKARNAGLDASSADWVMFCDFDDCFSNIYGLYLIFCAMNEDKYDTIWSNFTEETKDNEGRLVLVPHGREPENLAQINETPVSALNGLPIVYEHGDIEVFSKNDDDYPTIRGFRLFVPHEDHASPPNWQKAHSRMEIPLE